MSKVPFVRPKITKFFEADMLENYLAGSFWFGTLKRYRMIEEEGSAANVEPRFSDRREGIIENGHTFDAGHAKSVMIGGISITNSHFSGNGTDIMITHEVNEFVFCASYGGYSRRQHLDIKNGALSVSGAQYEGNPKLTHFAEIDLIDFIDAVGMVAPRTPVWNTQLTQEEYLLHDRVKYGNTGSSNSIPSIYETSGMPDYEDYLRTIFTKPAHFSPENEFRVVLRANAPYSLEDDPAGMKLKHKKLRRSITKTGFLDENF